MSAKWDRVDWMIVFVLVVLLFIMFLVLPACASRQVLKTHVVWSDGKCLLVLDGVSIEEAKDLSKEWNFTECDVNITNTEGAKK